MENWKAGNWFPNGNWFTVRITNYRIYQFIACHFDLTQATLMAEFGHYLGTVAAPECNLLTWRGHVDAHPHCAAIARHFLAIPASLAAYECLFLATSRLVDKHCSNLLHEHADNLILLNRNK